MCSINGCVDFCDPLNVRENEVCAVGRVLSHRGPDASGSFFAPGVGFYHNRLAVMDVERGKQPMQAAYKSVTYAII